MKNSIFLKLPTRNRPKPNTQESFFLYCIPRYTLNVFLSFLSRFLARNARNRRRRNKTFSKVLVIYIALTSTWEKRGKTLGYISDTRCKFLKCNAKKKEKRKNNCWKDLKCNNVLGLSFIGSRWRRGTKIPFFAWICVICAVISLLIAVN